MCPVTGLCGLPQFSELFSRMLICNHKERKLGDHGRLGPDSIWNVHQVHYAGAAWFDLIIFIYFNIVTEHGH